MRKFKSRCITGHYVSRIQKSGQASMYRAKDHNRDKVISYSTLHKNN